MFPRNLIFKNPYRSSSSKEHDIINNILNVQTILEYAEQNQEELALISLDNKKKVMIK